MGAAKKLSIRLEAVGGDKVRQEFKSIGTDDTKAFRQITNVITPANDNLKVINETAKTFNGVLKQAAGLAGAYLGLCGLTSTFKSIVGVNAEFERLSGSLKTVTGSVKAAKEAFSLIEDFATSTPYQLDEIVNSFIRLKAMGLEPSMEALTSYGNTASAFGKNILEFVSAVTSATVGEFERLKTFGIKAKVEGDTVKFVFQGVTTEVVKNATEIERYLRSIGNINFGGAMAEQMNTKGGTMSNIEDAMAKVARTIGESGLNDAIKGVLEQFNTLVSGSNSAAKSIGGALAMAVNVAGKAFFTLANNIEPIITLLTVRLGAATLKSSTNWKDGLTRSLQSSYADVTDMAKATENIVKNSFTAMEDTLTEFVMTGKASFSDFVNSIVEGMVRMAIQYAVIKPIMSGIMGYFGVPMAHTGGVIGTDTLSSWQISPDVFEGAPCYHTGGLVGDKIPIIAKRGETVFTKGQMDAFGTELNSKNPVNVNVHNNASGTKASASANKDAQGNVSIDVIVEQIESTIGKNISKGEGLSPILEQRYALNPAFGSYR